LLTALKAASNVLENISPRHRATAGDHLKVGSRKEHRMELVERIARVITGYRLSANADGAECSAADAVDALWAAHQDEAVAS
jgi:hypothetical protein